MSNDFFSKLGDHLDDAARREAGGGPRSRRATLARPMRAVAVAAAVLAVVAIGAAALPSIVEDDVERAADTPRPEVVQGPNCAVDKHSTTLPVEGGPFPERIRARFSVFAQNSKAEKVRPPIEGFSGLPVYGVQTKEARLVDERDGAEVYVVAVNHVYDEKVECAPKPGTPTDEARAALPEKLNPGVCVLLQGGKTYASACWSLKTIDAGESVLGPKPFDLLAAAVPDGHPTVEVGSVGRDNSFTAGGTADVAGNVALVAKPGGPDKPVQWRDAGLTPVDKTGSPPDYGCDGPVHPETLEAYNVLRNDPDPEGFEILKEPEGITFLSEPRLARESFGAKFWLVAAAAQPDCSVPVICIATDFGADAVECAPVEGGASTPVVSRLEPGGDPTLVIFAAVPDHTPPLTLEPKGAEKIDLDIEGNMAVAGGKFDEERARQIAEAVGGAPIRFTAESGATADHDDR